MTTSFEAKISGVFKTDKFRDKETGEIKDGSYKLELLVEKEMENKSVRNDLLNLTIPESRVKEFEAQIGKKIQFKCDISSKTPIFYKLQ